MKTEKAQRYLQRCMLELPNGSVKDALRELHMAFNVLREENAPDEAVENEVHFCPKCGKTVREKK